MSFERLPDNWGDLPLTDPALAAQVLDLLAGEADREVGALILLLCDEQGRLIQPCCVSEVERDCAPRQRGEVLGLFVEAMRDRPSGIVLGLARHGSAVPDDDDRAWHQSAIEACRGTSVSLLGAYVVATSEVAQLPPADRAA